MNINMIRTLKLSALALMLASFGAVQAQAAPEEKKGEEMHKKGKECDKSCDAKKDKRHHKKMKKDIKKEDKKPEMKKEEMKEMKK